MLSSISHKLILGCLFLIPQFAHSKVLQDSLSNSDSTMQTIVESVNRSDSLRKIDSQKISDLSELILVIRENEIQRTKELQRWMDSVGGTGILPSLLEPTNLDSLLKKLNGAPVVFHEDTLFYIYAKLGPLSPADRANHITEKLDFLVEEHAYNKDALAAVKTEDGHDIVHDQTVIMSVSQRDASLQGKTTAQLAEEYRNLIIENIDEFYERTGLFQLLFRIGAVFLVIIIFIIAIRLMNRGFTWLNAKAIDKSKKYLKGVHFRNYEFLSKEQEENVLRWLLKIIKWVAIVILVYSALPILFSIFPATKGIATTLLSYVLDPLKEMGLGFLNFIPEMITILVIVGFVKYFMKFLHFLTHEIEIGKLVIPGFYRDWAQPTFNLLRIFIYAFTFIIIFPYLPGSDSPIFRGVSVFLGLLISIGSSSAIGNIVAGLVITYMRAFKVGDRVKIGDATGDVIEKTMLVTRLRTIKNEEVTIPNSAILNGNTINYSTSARELGLILNTEVTIGYDVPWRKVHELLISAAKKTENINESPEPFVLQTNLNDFYVNYQLNAYTDDADKAAKIYSDLHSKIQDEFNEAGVEILSPHFQANRQG